MEKVKLGDITNSFDNIRKPISGYKRLEMKNGQLYPYYGANGIVDYINQYIFDDQYLCIAEDGGQWGKNEQSSYIISEKCWINNHVHVVKPNNEFNISFLNYYLNYADLNSYISGAVVRKLTKENLSKINIPNYDLPTQQKIVEELDCLSDIIEKKKQQLAELNNLVKSKFDEMFNTKCFQNRLLRDICIKITDGSHNPPKGINFSEYPMLSSQNINEGILFDNVRYLTKEDFERENKRTNVKCGDILITIVGTIGRSAIVNNEKITLQRSVAVLKPNEEINSYYLNEFLKSSKTQTQLSNKAHGASQKGVYLADLKTLSIIVPPIELQNKFADFVKNIEKLKLELKQSIVETQNLFNERMQHYFGD